MMRLKSKVAIVTGAATGIGQAIAVACKRGSISHCGLHRNGIVHSANDESDSGSGR